MYTGRAPVIRRGDETMRVALRLTLAVALFSSLLVSASGAQQPGQGTPPAQPTFRVNVDLVSSDVIVRNQRGQFVADLTRDDFEVFEDGVRQDLASFVLIHGGRAFASMTAAAPAPKEEGIILPPPRPTNDAAGRVFAFIVDDLHLDFRETGRIRALFRKMAKQLVHEGDLFGVVSTGPSSITVDLMRPELSQKRSRTDHGGGLRPSEIIEAGYGSQGPPEVRYRAHVGFSVRMTSCESPPGAESPEGGRADQQRIRFRPLRGGGAFARGCGESDGEPP